MAVTGNIRAWLIGMSTMLLVIILCVGSAIIFFNHRSDTYEDDIVLLMSSVLASFTDEDSLSVYNLDNKRALSSLGKFEGCSAKDENKVSIRFGRPTRASVILYCDFAESNATIEATLERVTDKWNVLTMSVTSPLFVVELPRNLKYK